MVINFAAGPAKLPDEVSYSFFFIFFNQNKCK
jgi:hypothetical protein